MSLKIQVGTRAVFVDGSLNCGGALDRYAVDSNRAAMAGKECVIAVVQDVPGKTLGVYFRDAIRFGHTLDGLVANGHGAWIVADDLYSADEHAAHRSEAADFAARKAEIDKVVLAFEDEP